MVELIALVTILLQALVLLAHYFVTRLSYQVEALQEVLGRVSCICDDTTQDLRTDHHSFLLQGKLELQLMNALQVTLFLLVKVNAFVSQEEVIRRNRDSISFCHFFVSSRSITHLRLIKVDLEFFRAKQIVNL